MPSLTVAPPFDDHFLTLQVHPEADARMIETAYWHLARRFNRRSDSSALAKLDDLNEAYSVLATPSRREKYVATRNAVLGEGTLPALHMRPPAQPALKVFERSKVRPKSTSS